MRGPTGLPHPRKRSLPSRNSNRRTSRLHASRRGRERLHTRPRERTHARTRERTRAHAHPFLCPCAHTHCAHLRKVGLNPHAILLSAQALPGITDGIVDGATGATGATGGPKPAGAGSGDFINISNMSWPKKARAPSTGAEMREMVEIDELLQEYGLE